MKPEDLKLYLVTDRPLCLGRDLEWVVREAVAGGATMVQLREKDTDTRTFIELAAKLKSELSPLGIPLIINDRVDVALAMDADGVHIGQSDMPYSTARRLLGPDKIIGLSVENMDDVRQANELDVDYIGVSPVYSTHTKTDTAAPFGLDGLREAVRLSKHPAVAIGGMNRNTAADVMDCGPDGIAVVSAIVSADSPKKASEELLAIVNAHSSGSAAAAPEPWSRTAWKAASAIFAGIIDHPFLREMASGSLDVKRFDRYIGQDERYLGNYGRQMFSFADMIADPEQHAMYMEFAKSGIEGERMMHDLLIDRFGIDTDVQPSIVTSSYNNHTQAALETGNKAVALAALLPCMWIYNEVGKHILRIADTTGNPYKEWIGEYGNDEFTAGVETVLRLADEYAAAETQEVRDRMTREFVEGTLYEYAFWDYGYYGEGKDYSYMNSPEKWK